MIRQKSRQGEEMGGGGKEGRELGEGEIKDRGMNVGQKVFERQVQKIQGVSDRWLQFENEIN